MELPESIYHVRRISDRSKPYYGRKDKRIYSSKNGVAAFVSANTPRDLFEIHLLEPGFDQWYDITDDFVCEHQICVCLTCGDSNDMNFEPLLHCHDDENHPTQGYDVRIEHRYKCNIHRRN